MNSQSVKARSSVSTHGNKSVTYPDDSIMANNEEGKKPKLDISKSRSDDLGELRASSKKTNPERASRILRNQVKAAEESEEKGKTYESKHSSPKLKASSRKATPERASQILGNQVKAAEESEEKSETRKSKHRPTKSKTSSEKAIHDDPTKLAETLEEGQEEEEPTTGKKEPKLQLRPHNVFGQQRTSDDDEKKEVNDGSSDTRSSYPKLNDNNGPKKRPASALSDINPGEQDKSHRIKKAKNGKNKKKDENGEDEFKGAEFQKYFEKGFKLKAPQV